jgi:hypothetical protein
MNFIFAIVYEVLKWFSWATALTYREINIVVYFIIIPFIFLLYIDRILKVHYLKIGFSLVTITTLFIINDFEEFSSLWFDRSVVFLKWFDVIGWDYIEASVIICVVLPAFVFALLAFLNRQSTRPSTPNEAPTIPI